MKGVATVGKRTVVGLVITAVLVIVALVALVGAVNRTESPLEVSLEESGARDGGHMVIVEADFDPRISTEDAIAIALESARESYPSPEEFPVFVSKARLWGWHDSRVEQLRDVPVRVVVFHDLPSSWRGPMDFPKPYPAEPRLTILIDDATGEIVQGSMTFGLPEQ